MDQKEIIRLW